MKAFEKKFKEQFPDLFPIKKQSDFVFRRAYKDGWRDALEWFKNTMDEIEKYDVSVTGEEVINRELEQ